MSKTAQKCLFVLAFYPCTIAECTALDTMHLNGDLLQSELMLAGRRLLCVQSILGNSPAGHCGAVWHAVTHACADWKELCSGPVSAVAVGVCLYSLECPPLCDPAAQKHNEEKLNEAFRQKCGVFLVFSVNMSGHFQGYARMMSYVSREQVWLEFTTPVLACSGAPPHPTHLYMLAMALEIPFQHVKCQPRVGM